MRLLQYHNNKKIGYCLKSFEQLPFAYDSNRGDGCLGLKRNLFVFTCYIYIVTDYLYKRVNNKLPLT